jgi:hypothetical protein
MESKDTTSSVPWLSLQIAQLRPPIVVKASQNSYLMKAMAECLHRLANCLLRLMYKVEDGQCSIEGLGLGKLAGYVDIQLGKDE